MGKHLSLAVLGLVLLPGFSLGQKPAQQIAGFSTVLIGDLNKIVDSIFSETQPTGPGCAVTLLADGNVLVRKAYGMANIENQVPFTAASVVRIPYSEAREFIAIAAVLMEQDGILQLTDKVRKYFPKLPDWAEPVTLWDLLNHSSGFVDEWATLLLKYNSMSNRFETDQFLQLLYTQPIPEVEPGKGYMYCNSDFGLLRLIMEQASGKKLPDWMQQRLFAPLEMTSTRMQKNPLEVIPNRADMYAAENQDGYQHASVQKTSPGGDYFILTSANDLERWAIAMNDPGSEINRAAVTLTERGRHLPGKENHYSIGYTYHTINGQQVIAHEGVNGYNYLTRIPSIGLSIITLGNRDGDGFAVENSALVDYFLQQPPPVFPTLVAEPITLPATALEKYAGNYRWQNQVSWEGTNPIRKFSSVFIADGHLKMRYTGNYTIALTPVGKDLFYYQEENNGFGAQFTFSQPSYTAPLRLDVIFDDGFPGATMAKDTGLTWQPSLTDLAAFTGTFYSKHLDYYWHIVLDDSSKLILKSTNLPDIPLDPDGVNQFHYIGEKYPGSGYDSWILFNKNDQGILTHLTVWSGRVMHHRFDKQ